MLKHDALNSSENISAMSKSAVSHAKCELNPEFLLLFNKHGF